MLILIVCAERSLGHTIHTAATTIVYSRTILSCLETAHDPACRFTQEELLAIDLEGRCVITDHETFILFNLYGPAITSEENAADRFAYKLRLYEVRGSMASVVNLDLLGHMDSICRQPQVDRSLLCTEP